MNKCINCGAELDDNVKFCPNCGTSVTKDVDIAATTTENVEVPNNVQPPKKTGPVFGIISLVSLFFGAALTIVGLAFGGFLLVVSLVFGIIAVATRSRKKIFGIIGLIGDGLFLIIFGFVSCITCMG